MVQSDLYKEAVATFGKDNQLIVTMGELAECTAELAKRFIINRDEDEQAIINELADVSIMMAQCEVIYGDRLNQAIHKKLDKVKGHIENARRNG